ncbi:Csu type fimbrial protein [Pseudomonas turukhanskensis]|uniref:Spore coat protein U n=1 Tax=Pseudomonas turukhanskensis TaxID=1806536 RepID=A0A9W6NIF4_9PSED|nr:spore coat U domain-containing protein [Pseudomonas turukhanskensis]GLK91751.1 spore coat protein U [Pseudomonas turukhanskensis]
MSGWSLRYLFLAALLCLLNARSWADTGVNDVPINKAFVVKAAIVNGCILGSGAADVTSYGNISFGQVSLLPSNVDVTSSTGADSILLQCTPGTSLTIGLSAGLNATNISAGRFLIKGSETLRYQLYQDAGTTIWGNGSNGGTVKSLTFPAGTATVAYPVFARLFAVTPMPSAGIYNDTVTVTITY